MSISYFLAHLVLPPTASISLQTAYTVSDTDEENTAIFPSIFTSMLPLDRSRLPQLTPPVLCYVLYNTDCAAHALCEVTQLLSAASVEQFTIDSCINLLKERDWLDALQHMSHLDCLDLYSRAKHYGLVICPRLKKMRIRDPQFDDAAAGQLLECLEYRVSRGARLEELSLSWTENIKLRDDYMARLHGLLDKFVIG
ncbi:hypothetical protein B0H21DRAFT_892965, partial [Amylocystis lapponica]